ncbi:MAG: hypothetical protein ACOYNC_02565 [Bacteroidales bacterium]
MKTTKLIFALTFALIFATGVNAMNTLRDSGRDVPAERKARMVSYVVRIENMNYLENHGTHYLVMMTDETGRQVAPAQNFSRGVSDYRFYEGGTVRGTRVARIMRLPMGPKSFDIPATSQTGIFYGGSSYLFIIKPIPSASDTGADKN